MADRFDEKAQEMICDFGNDCLDPVCWDKQRGIANALRAADRDARDEADAKYASRMTAPLSIEEIERLEALEKAATPGPWVRGNDAPKDPQWIESEEHPSIAQVFTGSKGVVVNAWNDKHHDNAALIAALRNAAPALLAMARQWKERGDALIRMNSALVRANTDRNDADIENGRLLAALKAEAIADWQRAGDHKQRNGYEPLIGGIYFRVTRDPKTGELVAEEVRDV